MFDYEKRCAAATTAQGLDPVVEALTEADINHVVVQTGGFCMAVVVQRSMGSWVVTMDPNPYVGWYAGNDWVDGEDLSSEHEPETLTDLVALIRTAP